MLSTAAGPAVSNPTTEAKKEVSVYYTYQPIDGPIAPEPLALLDDQFDYSSDQIEITINGTQRIAVYRRSRKSIYGSYEYKTIYGDWSYKHDAIRELVFVGYKN